jgi:hypothetical protein
MGKILSIDLAYKKVRDFGVCLLEKQRGKHLSVRFVNPARELRLEEPPNAHQCAQAIREYCQRKGIPIVFLDGPQGWKSARNGLKHSRICEKLLNTPGKTGLRGKAKPESYLPFIRFSIDVFTHLVGLSATLLSKRKGAKHPKRFLILESFPRAAWKSLGIIPLPSKKRCRHRPWYLHHRLRRPQELYRFRVKSLPTHDELQALIAGLAGIGILEGNSGGYIAVGSPPKHVDGVTVEGFIVNPRKNSEGAR